MHRSAPPCPDSVRLALVPRVRIIAAEAVNRTSDRLLDTGDGVAVLQRHSDSKIVAVDI